MYPDVEHCLPQYTRPLGNDHLQITLGRYGGVRITNRTGGAVVSTGVWLSGAYEADETTADS